MLLLFNLLFSDESNLNFLQAKQLQEYQLRLGASSRELDLLKSHVKNTEVKITQLQELLATREQEHRYTDLKIMKEYK